MGTQCHKGNQIKKWVQRGCSLLWWLAVILLALVLLHVGSAKLRGEIPEICGYSVFRITTGSMEPTIPTGTYILTRKTPAEEIRQGDIITFYSQDPEIYNMPNTHRVTAPPEQTDGELLFLTRGDGNLIQDEFPVPENRLIGRYVGSLQKLTAFVNFFMTKGMLVALLVLQGVGVVMMQVSVRLLRNKKQQSSGKPEEQNITETEEAPR